MKKKAGNILLENFYCHIKDLAELIPHPPKCKLEEIVQKYVTELAQRSLVQVVNGSMAC
jgi:hypothetical protein